LWAVAYVRMGLAAVEESLRASHDPHAAEAEPLSA
jgi:hypothetical protein